MKNLYVLLLALAISTTGYSQLTGTKTIPGDYATIAAAITALNTQGVGAGGVTFNVAAGHTETFATATTGTITATGTAANPVIFQKSGAGVNPIITASGAGTLAPSTTIGTNGDGVIIINGGDYFTFDGINIQEFTGATGNARSEYGYFLKKASGTDACKNITIKNCTITLDKTNIYSFGIYASNISGTTEATVTTNGGRTENVKFYSNNISNAYGSIMIRGFNDPTAPHLYYDQNNEVGVDGGNTFTNLGGGSTTMYSFYAMY